jgi:hypothetical protein
MLVAGGFMTEVPGRGGSIPLDFVRLKLWDWLPNSHSGAFQSICEMGRRRPDWFREELAALFALLSGLRRAHARIEAGEVRCKRVHRGGGR